MEMIRIYSLCMFLSTIILFQSQAVLGAAADMSANKAGINPAGIKSGDKDFSVSLESTDSESSEKDLDELFLDSVILEDYAQLEKHLSEGANLEAKDDSGNTAMHWACYAKTPSILAFLLAKGANVNAINKMRKTPLHDACFRGKIELIKLLAEAGALLEEADISGNTPLHQAVRSANVAAVACLLSRGANPYARTDLGNSPLNLACDSGDCEIASLLAGINFVKDENGFLKAEGTESSMSLPGSSADVLPAWQRMLCTGYIESIPDDIEFYAQQVAQNLGVEGVVFFKTDQTSHASDNIFPRIGLSERELQVAYRAVRKRERHAIIEFKRVLYHELTHLKSKHFTKRKLQDVSCESLFALAQEMEAELSAMYLLFTRDNIALLYRYPIDEYDQVHPSGEDQLRFNVQLYDRLLRNPEAGYGVVHDLTALYVQQKESGMRESDVIMPQVAKELLSRRFVSRTAYRRFVGKSECCVLL